MTRYVVGVGVASAATPDELARLVAGVLAEAGIAPGDVAAVATVASRAAHPAVAALGWPVVAVDLPAPAPAGGTPGHSRPPSGAPGSGRPPGVTSDSGRPSAPSRPAVGTSGPSRPAVGSSAPARPAGGTSGARPAVAEPAALAAAGAGAVLVVRKRRSAQATAAVARITGATASGR